MDLQADRAPSGERSVGYALSQLGFESSRRFGELIATVGLEPRHFALLSTVAREEGQSQQALAERLHIPASTMVAVVDSLEHEGLVERRLHASDRRTRTLHLTPLGADTLKKATALAWNWEAVVCDGFDAAERRHLLDMLGRVAANVGVAGGSLPGMGSSESPLHPAPVCAPPLPPEKR